MPTDDDDDRPARRPRRDDDDDDRPARRPKNSRDDDDDAPVSRSRSGASMPGGAKAAGMIWIVYGSLGILSNIVSLVMSLGQGGVGANLCGTVIGLLIAGAFLFVGIQTVKGTAASMMGNGIGSLILGVLQLSCGGLIMAGGGIMAAGGAGNGAPAGAGAMGGVAMILGGVVVVLGLSLIVAGIVALMNKSAYEAWRASQGLGKRRRPSAEERDYDDRPGRRSRNDEDDEDERPRRRRDED